MSTILSLNIRGLSLARDRAKHLQLRDRMSMANSIGAVVTESWLNPNMCDAEVAIPGFSVFRADRRDRIRGGVAIYLREDLAAVQVLNFSNSTVEAAVVKVRDLECLVVGVYRPPNTSYLEWEEALAAISQEIEFAQAHSHKFSTVHVFGDLNFPGIQWPVGECLTGDRQATDMLGSMRDQFLTNRVLVPTREGNILDLVLTNNQESISHVTVEENSKRFTDHRTLVTYLTFSLTATKVERECNKYATTIPEHDIRGGDEEDWRRYRMLFDQFDWESAARELQV
jgi:hypothetical protein